MKFLIQKINKEVRHDFSFTLLESIRFHNWLNDSLVMKHSFINTNNDIIIGFKDSHEKCVPVGSVEFVQAYMKHFDIPQPLPMNVPDELISHAGRRLYNGTHVDVERELDSSGRCFIKSADKIKGTTGIINKAEVIPISKGNYQISEVIDIQSEWRCFVYKDELVGIQNYSGDFTLFPSISKINSMITDFKSAPIAYTLDVGVSRIDRSSDLKKTFVVESHDMFSVGLYGFSNHRILPHMFHRWFREYLIKVLTK